MVIEILILTCDCDLAKNEKLLLNAFQVQRFYVRVCVQEASAPFEAGDVGAPQLVKEGVQEQRRGGCEGLSQVKRNNAMKIN